MTEPTAKSPHRAVARRRRRGFTLLEILVAIGIIMILMTIGVYAYRSVSDTTARRATHVALDSAQGMLANYAASTGGGLDTGNMKALAMTTSILTPPTDVNAGASGRTTTITRCQTVLTELTRLPDNQKALAQLPTKLTIAPASGTLPGLADGWGNPIYFVGAAGMYATVNGVPKQVIVAPNKQPFWVSAGPDGDFSLGDDNVYSFEK